MTAARTLRWTGWLLLPALASGCSCEEPPSFCQLLADRGPAWLKAGPNQKIFAGKVLSSIPATEQAAWALERRHAVAREDRKRFWVEQWGAALSSDARAALLGSPHRLFDYGSAAFSQLEVVEPFVNSKQGEIVEMFGTLGCCDCSFHFTPGATYLVNADRSSGLWSTSACSRSQRIEGTLEDLETLRAVRDGKPASGTIFGSAVDTTNRWGRPVWAKLPHFPLRLNGPAGPHEAETDARGRLRFRDLPAGEYRLESGRPDWTLRLLPADSSIQLANGCREIRAALEQQQSVLRGRVQAAPGHVLAPFPIMLVALSPPLNVATLPHATPGVGGSFELRNVEPGDYLVAVNPTDSRGQGNAPSFYPGVSKREQAETIHIERGVEIALPKLWVLAAPEP